MVTVASAFAIVAAPMVWVAPVTPVPSISPQVLDSAIRSVSPSPTPSAITTGQPPPTNSAAPSSSPAAPAASTGSNSDGLGLTASYSVAANFSWASRAITVTTTASVRNTSGSSVARLVFNVTPLTLATIHIDSVSAGATPASFTRDNPDQALTVTLPTTLAVGGTTSVKITYHGSLNSTSSGDSWLFARTTVVTAYRWIPWLSRAIAWVPSELGDPWVTGISPHVDVTLTTDQPLKVASTGQQASVSADGLVQTFSASNVRDFNFTAAPDYRTMSRTVSVGGKTVHVILYYRTLPPQTILKWATRALKSYSSHIAPYVYDQLSIGEADPNASPIESPGHFWVPAGTSAQLLPWTVAHETGHQWFYAAVGNDQVMQPFADEAVVDFMARNLTDTWASSPARCGQQELDRSISYYGSCYPWVIYVQGNLYLKAYYQHVGSAAFWRGLRNYFAAYKWQFGGTRQLLDSLDAAANICHPHWQRFPTLYPSHC